MHDWKKPTIKPYQKDYVLNIQLNKIPSILTQITQTQNLTKTTTVPAKEFTEKAVTRKKHEPLPSQSSTKSPAPLNKKTFSKTLDIPKKKEPINSSDNQSDNLTGPHQSRENYIQELLHAINQNKFYPRRARKRNQQGIVTIGLDINKYGRFENVHIKASSGHRKLDRAAMDVFIQLAAFKPLPSTFYTASLNLAVPMEYSLQ